MKATAFLNLAQRLLTNEKNAAGLRSAISRAYYAAFHETSDFLKRIGCQVPDDATGHKKAYFYLNNCNDDPLIEAAAYLDNLHGDRNEADYDLTAQRVEKEPIAQNVVATAEKVIKALDECNKSDQRKKDVAMAVQAYKQQNKM